MSTSPRAALNWSSVSRNGNLIYSPANTSESVGYLLNTYHYTIYAPTNEAMADAYSKGLPTLEMLDEAREIDDDDSTVIVVAPGDTIKYAEINDSAAHLQKVMLDFVKYHIQDNSIYIDKGFESGNYESGKINPSTGRSFKLAVNVDNAGTTMTVKGICSPAQEINKSVMYNKMAREFWLNNTNVNNATLINTSSGVVVHAIDKPLLYKYYADRDLALPENNQFIYSPNEVYTEEEEYEIRKRAEIYKLNKRINKK